MVDHVLDRWGDPASGYAIGPGGVEARKLRAWLAARQRDGRPVLVMATTLALEQALDQLERLGLRFRLPAGSLLFETGGSKGRRRQVAPQEMAQRVELALGLAPRHTVREYGMTELTSQLYTATLSGGAGDLFVAPPWVRVRVLDAETLEPLPRGRTGVVAIFDLANVGSALHVLTEDLGTLLEGGLRLDGRARGADLRGCSLAAEELAASGTTSGGRPR
jgi:hypothetical protein